MLQEWRELLEKEHKDFNLDEIISEIYSGYAELPNKEKKDNKYTFYKLLKYVNEKLPINSPILTNLPTDYSIMSSFILFLSFTNLILYSGSLNFFNNFSILSFSNL